MKRTILAALAALGFFVSGPEARASEHELYYARAGALLNHAEGEVRVLYAAVTQRVFDPTVTRQATEELKRLLTEAKRQTRRAQTLLPEKLASREAAVEKLRQQIIAAERQLERFETVVTAAIEALTRDEDELDEEDEAAPETDWKSIRSSCAWLAKDIKTARTTYAGLARTLAIGTLRTPPAPSGPRPE